MYPEPPPPPSPDDPELSPEEIERAKEENFKRAWKDINHEKNKDLINETLRTTQVNLDSKTFEDFVKKGRLPEIKRHTFLELLELLENLKPDVKRQLGIDIMENETFEGAREKILLGLIKDRQQAQDFVRKLRENKSISVKNLFFELLKDFEEKDKEQHFKDILTDNRSVITENSFNAFFNRLDQNTQNKYYDLLFNDLNGKKRIEKALSSKYGRKIFTPYELFSYLFEELKKDDKDRHAAFEEFLHYDEFDTIIELLYTHQKNDQLAILKSLEKAASSRADEREKLNYIRELLETVEENEDIKQLFNNKPKAAFNRLEKLATAFESKHLRDFILSLFKKYSEEQSAEVAELLKDLTDINKELIDEWLDIQSEEDLNKLMKTFVQTLYSEKTQRKGLAKSYEKNATYDNLLSNMTPSEKCETLLIKALPNFYCALPHIDWINAIYFPSPINPYDEHALSDIKYSNQFNTLNQLGLFIKPYSFYASIDEISTNFYTLGFSLGANYKLVESLSLSLSLGYSYSHINIKSDTTHSNRLFLGPSISYNGRYGYFSGTLLGTFNLYNHTRISHLFPEEKPESIAETHADSYGFDGRLEGGIFIPIGSNFFLTPSAKLDLTWIYLPKIKEELETDVSIKTTHALRNQYLSFEGLVTFTREAYKEAFGYIIPHVSVGAIYYHPRSVDKSHYFLEHDKEGENCNPCDMTRSVECSLDAWWQARIGAGLSILRVSGFSFGMDYQFRTGNSSTIHYVEMRFGITW